MSISRDTHLRQGSRQPVNPRHFHMRPGDTEYMYAQGEYSTVRVRLPDLYRKPNPKVPLSKTAPPKFVKQLPPYDPRTFGITVGLRAIKINPRDRINITNAPKQIRMRRVIDYNRCTPKKLVFDSDSDSDEEDNLLSSKLSFSQDSNDSGFLESSQGSISFDTHSQCSQSSLDTSFLSQDSCFGFNLNDSVETLRDADFTSEDIGLTESSCLDVTVASNTEQVCTISPMEIDGDPFVRAFEKLIKSRDEGVYAKCDDCEKWRLLENTYDPSELPDKWTCKDAGLWCSDPEDVVPDEKKRELIENQYHAGSIVWVNQTGSKYWPAIVDDCIEKFRYFKLEQGTLVPKKYHVTYLDSKLLWDWVSPERMKPYHAMSKAQVLKSESRRSIKPKLRAACNKAEAAAKMQTMSERLFKFSLFGRLMDLKRKNEAKSQVPAINNLSDGPSSASSNHQSIGSCRYPLRNRAQKLSKPSEVDSCEANKRVNEGSEEQTVSKPKTQRIASKKPTGSEFSEKRVLRPRK